MKTFKQFFIKYAPAILLLPSSIIIGMYLIHDFETLTSGENLPFFYVYVLFCLAPLYFFVFKPRQDIGTEILEIGRKFFERFRMHSWAYLVIALGFSAFFLFLASIHISTYLERDRWIISEGLPVIPLDMVIMGRTAYVMSWFFPIDFASPLANLPFILLWLAFLVYINPVEENSWISVLTIFTGTVLTTVLYVSLYGVFEFPAAVVCFIGLYAIWRKKINTGIFFLVLGSVLKNTGIFQFIPGGILLLMHCWEAKSFKKVFEKLDIALLVFLGFFWLLNNWGLYVQIFIINHGLGYLVKPRGDEIIWLSAFLTFTNAMITKYFILTILWLIGIILLKEHRLFALTVTGTLLFARSFSRWADPEYTQIFVPSLSYIALLSLVHLQKSLKLQLANFLLPILILGFNIFYLYGLLQYTPNGMNRLNSNFDQYIGKLARRFPEEGLIYERGVSVMPYLREQRGGNLDAIRFRYLTGWKDEIITELSQPGCKLIIIQKDFLGQTGMTEADLISLGYSTSPYILDDRSGTFISYSRSCNDWENN